MFVIFLTKLEGNLEHSFINTVPSCSFQIEGRSEIIENIGKLIPDLMVRVQSFKIKIIHGIIHEVFFNIIELI